MINCGCDVNSSMCELPKCAATMLLQMRIVDLSVFFIDG